ncbi:MAG: hypothetical protein ILP10_02355, partial [Lachnospiraceae bacterium]|nr:hypothetical protein [Lachnospiraceae bacterium]
MIKGYRKRFVLFNMLLVGSVLIIALVAQWIFLYRSSFNEMKNTMRLVVEPWGRQGPKMDEVEDGSDRQGPKTDEVEGGSDRQGPPRDEVRANDEYILTVFYDRATDEVMILPEGT